MLHRRNKAGLAADQGKEGDLTFIHHLQRNVRTVQMPNSFESDELDCGR